MGEMMKICGKTPSSTAKGIKVNSDGNLVNEKKWANGVSKIANAIEIRDTTAVVVDGGSVDDAGMISLRIYSSLDKPVKIEFYSDSSTNGGSTVMTGYGYDAALEIDSSIKYRVITSYDIPFLNYLRYIKLRVQATEAPTSGSITIYLHTKR